MKLPEGDWLELDTVDSTQSHFERLIRAGDQPLPPAIRARHQESGKGRFGRAWIDAPGTSLILSIALPDYAGHPRPWLLGMALACAAAGAVHCRIRWPNDLYLDGKKLGGILTEIFNDVPVLGIGINLNQTSLPPEIATHAISLTMHRPPEYDPSRVARLIWNRLAALPEIDDWDDLAPLWHLYDDTPGKRYRIGDDEEAVAMGIGPHGELLCSVRGESRTVLAAQALLG